MITKSKTFFHWLELEMTIILSGSNFNFPSFPLAEEAALSPSVSSS
jgi:hypothetical protein